ncbi:hypothetical protein Ssi02_66340 [Sinosporangium siamense]|uniref:Uncharacterized protein n=1 Tax=Sinosporangium siamense TaxID=1367973 RepID=A0A919RMC7_9ACTN|nr:hypothetical protein Ssi02_66340 [Sinosporangium siamense]
MLPSELPTRTYSETMAFGAFLTDRAAEDLSWRRDAVRAGGAARPITVHTAFPSVFCTGEFFEYEPAPARGNDFDLADRVDGFGSSHFPAWMHTAPVDYASRLEANHSAAGDKEVWISELQGRRRRPRPAGDEPGALPHPGPLDLERRGPRSQGRRLLVLAGRGVRPRVVGVRHRRRRRPRLPSARRPGGRSR